MKEVKDTLTIDWQLIQEFDDDYDQEFALKEKKEFKLPDFKLNSKNLPEKVDMIVLFVVFSIILGLLLFIAIHYFGRNKKKVVSTFIPEEDTIYGVDFQASLAETEAQNNYYQCIRLRYLWLLRKLHDRNKIYWAPQKTPEEYTYEYSKPELKEATNEFLKVRYGNYEATEEGYEKMKTLFDTLTEGKEVNHG